MPEQRTVATPYGEITYILTVKPVKNINLRISGGEVRVSAAARVPKRILDEFVASRAELVFRALGQRKKAAPQQYADGAEIYILGKPAVIRTAARGKSFYSCGVLTLCVPSAAPDACRVAYERWQADFCPRLFREMTDRVHELYARPDIPNPAITVRDMRSRWGSCRPDMAKITLNAQLLHAPPECTFYVIAHELAHFVQPNHSAAFYAVVGTVMPDYKERKRLLEEFARR